jgi:glutathione peroxidase-family protein
MRSQSPFVALAILSTLCPLALANTEPEPQQQTSAITEYKYNSEYKIIDKADISSPDEAALAQHIGTH